MADRQAKSGRSDSRAWLADYFGSEDEIPSACEVCDSGLPVVSVTGTEETLGVCANCASAIRPRGGGLRIFQGRTGAGMEIAVDGVDAWLDVRYIGSEGDVHGFSLNPKYAAELAVALVDLLAERAQR